MPITRLHGRGLHPLETKPVLSEVEGQSALRRMFCKFGNKSPIPANPVSFGGNYHFAACCLYLANGMIFQTPSTT